jgi:DNA-binding response OmpR family regulator
VGSPSRTVLVVDDDPSIRMLCRVNLEFDGWLVLEAGTIEQARAQLNAAAVDVVVLDVHVGSGNGAAFLEELRDDRPDLKVAMLTGSDRLEGIEGDALIPKPFTIEQLTTTVANLAG